MRSTAKFELKLLSMELLSCATKSGSDRDKQGDIDRHKDRRLSDRIGIQVRSGRSPRHQLENDKRAAMVLLILLNFVETHLCAFIWHPDTKIGLGVSCWTDRARLHLRSHNSLAACTHRGSCGSAPSTQPMFQRARAVTQSHLYSGLALGRREGSWRRLAWKATSRRTGSATNSIRMGVMQRHLQSNPTKQAVSTSVASDLTANEKHQRDCYDAGRGLHTVAGAPRTSAVASMCIRNSARSF
jgi:hypothetical protein